MKFINRYEYFENDLKIDIEDIFNIFTSITDLGYKFDYEFINIDKPIKGNLDKFLRSLGTEFLFDDTDSGNNKLYVLRQIENFLVITLDRDFTTSDLYQGYHKLIGFPRNLIDSEFNTEHKNQMIETLEEVEDRIEGEGYEFFNNFYRTDYSDGVTWVRIHYFIFEKSKSKYPRMIEIPHEEFNFRGSN